MTDILTGDRVEVGRVTAVSADTPPSPAEPTAPVTVLTRRTMPMMLLLGLFAVLARLAAAPLSNSDTFFHLRFGHEFLSVAWSLRDPGSVTALGTADWVPTQWLPQVVMAQLESWWGLPAVAWFAGLQFLALAVTVHLVARRWADPVVAAPLAMFVVIASASGLSMRPQVISYVLTALTAALWLGARESGRAPWVLVPLTWFWATYHGMWPVALSIGLVACLGIRLDGAARGAALGRMLAVPVLSAAAAALTPVGPRLYAAVLSVSGRGQYFGEWGPPDFTAPNCAALLVVLGVTALVLMRGLRPTWTQALVLALAACWAVYSSRTVPVAAALVTPVAALALQSLVGPRTPITRPERVVVWGGAAATLVVLALVTPHTAAEPAPQPSWVDPTLSALPGGTRILNDSGYGGYLMWAYPQLDVVLNGYGDLFTDAELKRNDTIEGAKAGWAELVHDTGARHAMTSHDSPLGYNLELQGWRVVHHSADVDYLDAPPDW